MDEDFFRNNVRLGGLLSSAAGTGVYGMDPVRQAAVMPMTQEAVSAAGSAAPFDLSAVLGGLGNYNFSGFGGGRMGGVIENPNIQYIAAPLSDKGNPTSKSGGNMFTMTPDKKVRLVDNRTKQVVFEGTGYEAARRATELGQSLSDQFGKKASYVIQTADPTGDYVTVAREKKNKSFLGKIADIALPIAASFIPGVGPVLGAALGSAASSVAQGRSLENTLLRAGLAAGGSALGGQVLGKAASGVSSSGVNADLIPNALQGLNFGSLASASIPAGVGSTLGNVAGDIVVNAARSAVPSLLGSAAGSVAGSALPSLIGGSPSAPDEIVVTGSRPTQGNIGDTLGSVSSLLNPLPSTPDEIVVTGSRPTEGNLGSTVGGVVGALSPTLPTTPPSQNDGVLGTGLNIPQILSLGGIGADLLQSLLGGGGGAGATTPYVSPFGAGVGFGAGQDMRANPEIIDYERYGFGPEAMFFRPEYSGLIPAGAPTQGQTTTATAPTYRALI